MLEPTIEARLVRRARDGDREAFDVLVRHVGGPLVGLVRRVTGDAEHARDIAQEALMRAWTRLATLRDPSQFRPWLHRIAVNLCRDRVRRRKGMLEVAIEHAPDASGSDGVESPHDVAVRRDRAVAVRRALQRLPVDQRTAIVLREFEGYTSREIGDLVGAPAATVRSRIFHGLRSLRAMLPEHEAIAVGDQEVRHG